MNVLDSIKILSNIFIEDKKDIEDIYSKEIDGKTVIVVKSKNSSIKSFIPSTVNSIPIIFEFVDLVNLVNKSEDKKMSDVFQDPFIEIAKCFPFTEKLELIEEEVPKLINALIDYIGHMVEKNETQTAYNRRAALHLRFLYDDYKVDAAADYWDKLMKYPKGKLGTDFYQATRINEILAAIYKIRGTDGDSA